jgi:prepilin-type N-terminal cleavage/methylation domain-containing protein
MRRAFTLMELVVALGIMALVMSFAGVIFRVSTDSHRLALANAEIMQKLRAITEQLDADFRGLRQDGEVLVFWRAQRKANYTGANRNAEEAFERFDRIMFFTEGDFQTYRASPALRGNMARVSYALASGPSANPAEPNRPQLQKPERRILARTEHLLVPLSRAVDPCDPLGTGKWTDSQWRDWLSNTEYDSISMRGWELIPLARKVDILSVIGDVEVGLDGRNTSQKNVTVGGVTVDPNKPDSLHAFLCRGVGQFQVQGWSDAEHRWIPQVNPNGDASLKDDSDFVLEGDQPTPSGAAGSWNSHQGSDLDPRQIPGVWYPRQAIIGNTAIRPLDRGFNAVPGLGRALKFTFTLYDSRGLVKGGRTFTHIVYLDN